MEQNSDSDEEKRKNRFNQRIPIVFARCTFVSPTLPQVEKIQYCSAHEKYWLVNVIDFEILKHMEFACIVVFIMLGTEIKFYLKNNAR